MAIGGRTRLAGLVGWPVASSRSPLIHNEWLRRAGIDGAYVPLPVAPGMLDSALAGLRAAGFAGVNVTLPHKEAAFAFVQAVDGRLTAAARVSGSVNTLCFEPDGGISGDSTDGLGFLESLRAGGFAPDAGSALVLGAGGAARAVVAALAQAGMRVAVANRTAARTAALIADLGKPGVVAIDWERRGAALPAQRLLVNTTSIGMGDDGGTPCPLDAAPDGLVVSDIVYVPRVTPLLAQARARGLRTVEGLGMLLHQAAVGFERWFGVVPVVDAALAELVRADLDQPG